MKILLIDACPRTESRSRRLALSLLSHLNGEVTVLKLTDVPLPQIDEQAVADRTMDSRSGCFDAPVYDVARQFASADTIVIAAPCWDLSFPAILKQYIEAITVSGITFRYSEKGIPIGLCRAQHLYYVTTAGGPIFNEEFGYGYLRTLAQGMYGIPDCRCFKAENLDIIGSDVERILQQAEKEIAAYFQKSSDPE